MERTGLYMNIGISSIIVFLVIAWFIYAKFYENREESFEIGPDEDKVTMLVSDIDSSPTGCVKKARYVTDAYPWWRSTRWWNYDGWLYQSPYYNYFRRPQYYNYWVNSKPTVMGGKRYYQRSFF